jgi:hypothetical protein
MEEMYVAYIFFGLETDPQRFFRNDNFANSTAYFLNIFVSGMALICGTLVCRQKGSICGKFRSAIFNILQISIFILFFGSAADCVYERSGDSFSHTHRNSVKQMTKFMMGVPQGELNFLEITCSNNSIPILRPLALNIWDR